MKLPVRNRIQVHNPINSIKVFKDITNDEVKCSSRFRLAIGRIAKSNRLIPLRRTDKHVYETDESQVRQ